MCVYLQLTLLVLLVASAFGFVPTSTRVILKSKIPIINSKIGFKNSFGQSLIRRNEPLKDILGLGPGNPYVLFILVRAYNKSFSL